MPEIQYDTIEFKRKYTDINEVLYWIIEQAAIGVPYCEQKFPKFSDPAEMYYYFLGKVTFHPDPPKTELIQSPGTLFEHNYFGRPGYGDCDCFVTLLISACWANGWNDLDICLYGRSKRWPSHISMAVTWEGKTYYMDLTEKVFDKERWYPLKQVIPVK